MKENKAKQMVETALASLLESVEKGESEALRTYLQAMSRFSSYSLHNILLIASQRPDATYVAGFHAWKRLGRFVSKGQKGIAIIAPLLYKSEPVSDDTNQTDLHGFRVVYVFDITQTNGDELPEPSHVQGDPAHYIPKLDALIDDRGILLEYSDTLRPEGASFGGKIVIRSGQTPACDFAVKVHELAHELLHHSSEKFSKAEVETEAEAVAFVVCNSIGLDTNTAFSDYIQMHRGDAKTLMSSLQRIRETSGLILEGLGR